jgi:hypothetical protein
LHGAVRIGIWARTRGCTNDDISNFHFNACSSHTTQFSS